jgi:hypothetical protein
MIAAYYRSLRALMQHSCIVELASSHGLQVLVDPVDAGFGRMAASDVCEGSSD